METSVADCCYILEFTNYCVCNRLCMGRSICEIKKEMEASPERRRWKMSTEAARRYHYNQATSVAESLQRILNRINFRSTPEWLITELENSSQTAQCIQAARRRDIEDYEQAQMKKGGAER